MTCVIIQTRRLGAFPWDALVYELLPKVRMSENENVVITYISLSFDFIYM